MQVIKNLDELRNLAGPDLDVFFDADNVELSGYDLSALSSLKFKDGAKVDLSNSVLPKDLDVSMCDEVDLTDCDLTNNKLAFKKDSVAILDGATLPNTDDIDVSKCGQVFLRDCDLRNAKLTFAKDSGVDLRGAVLPDTFDLSACQAVVASGCDLANTKLIFAVGSWIWLE